MYNDQVQDINNKAPKNGKKRGKHFMRSFLYMMCSMAITTTILLTLMFIILSEIDSNLLIFSKADSRTDGSNVTEVTDTETALDETLYTLPNFVGSYLENLKGSADYLSKYTLVETEEYNDEYPAGVVYEQNPAENTQSDEMIIVEVKISKGAAPIPDDIVGMYQEDAEAILKGLEIPYQIVTAFDNTVDKGKVIKITRAPGEVIVMVSEGSMDGTSGSGDLVNPDGSINWDNF